MGLCVFLLLQRYFRDKGDTIRGSACKNSQIFYLENVMPFASYFYLRVTYVGRQVWHCFWETDLATLNIGIHHLA